MSAAGPDVETPSDGTPAGAAAAALHATLRDAGARIEPVDGRPTIVSFGDPEEEHRALRGAAALLDDTDRCLLEVRGASAREHFGGLVTNHVEALEPGQGLYAFMLTPRGRPVAEMRVVAREPEEGEEVLWVDMPAACASSAREHLGRYLPPRLARFEPLERHVRLGVAGPRADEALEALGAERLPADPLAAGELRHPSLDAAAVVVRREEPVGTGHDVYLAAGDLTAAWDALADGVARCSGRPAGHRAREVWRVERGIPVYGREITPDVLPQETGQTDRAVDFEKGCYTGQEVVARIHYRGKVNRHLRGLRIDEELEALPAPGDELFDGERSRGTITTSLLSPRMGPIALGYVRREVEPGDRLALEPGGDPACRVEVLPFRDR